MYGNNDFYFSLQGKTPKQELDAFICSTIVIFRILKC